MPAPIPSHAPAVARPAHARLAGLVALGVVGLVMSVGVGPETSRWVQAGAWVVVSGVVGWVLWLRRRDRLAYEQALAAESARRAVAEDRLAIARELHDVVSGGLGAVTVRAAVAQRLETGPEGLRAALADVEGAAREATVGLRRMMAVLRGEVPEPRADGGPAGDGASPVGGGLTSQLAPGTRPAPTGTGPEGLRAALEPVLVRARITGLTVETDVAGAVDPDAAGALTGAVRRATVAVVGEALTNTARHAGPTRARVTLTVEPPGQGAGEPGTLHLAVVDHGPVPGWQPHPGSGHGLTGLAETVAAAGGRFAARRRGPGFAVEAAFPLGGVGS